MIFIYLPADLDECEIAAEDSVQLCRGQCRNLYPGYRCSNNSYTIPCEGKQYGLVQRVSYNPLSANSISRHKSNDNGGAIGYTRDEGESE